jgi:hypothetical protein
MTLRQKQSKFALMVAELILWAHDQGYELTFGEAWRIGDPRLHGKRLAIDLNLFINGKYQTSTEAHRPLGEKWKRMGGSWGGDFKKPDGNHYSLEHGGVR